MTTLEALKQRSPITSDHATIRNTIKILAQAPLEALFDEKNSFRDNPEEFMRFFRYNLIRRKSELPENLGELICNIQYEDYTFDTLAELCKALAALCEGYMVNSFGGD